SPRHVTESDPEEDPEEYEDDETEDGPVDYPMDGGDDDGDSSRDDQYFREGGPSKDGSVLESVSSVLVRQGK
ncbi:hypothetical protein Tco_1207089, partial [Tanacetum coccineum]